MSNIVVHLLDKSIKMVDKKTGKIGIRATEYTVNKIKKIADKEKRTFSQMTEILLLEAIEARVFNKQSTSK